ncbi:MAG: asparagine synthase (glutamine-hydrolyzing) [Adlercreutzia sp.]|nr:asparagine synthase (glutamine-hydrolyzing) [Adlercreutzia sp.]
MCGFVGFVDEERGYDRLSVLQAMAAAIAHRGPDAEGLFDDGRCALGFRRLAIIDLEGANQPLLNEDGSLVLVFNGEIYNYRELRRRLTASGHVFTTEGDGEVLVHGFEQWGTGLLGQLRGMFAFALYNRATGELFCARDAFGIKPLYYTAEGRRLLFGSEIKGLLPHPRFQRRLNEGRVATYLCMEYQPDDETLFEGVRKLPAGHWMRWRDGALECQRWFFPRFTDAGKAPRGSLDRNAALIADTLRDSVATHAVADVEVGCFLSAGVDSSLVAHEAARIMDGRTFTVGWGEEAYSELAAAADFAKATGLRNRQRVIDDRAFFASVPAVQYAMDEPLPNPSAVPLYHLCHMAAEDVKVVMSGEGADELFGGYPYYQECLAFEPYGAVPAPLRRAVARAASRLPEGTHGRRFLMRGAEPFARRYLRWEYNFTFTEASELLHPDLGGSGFIDSPNNPLLPSWALERDLVKEVLGNAADEVTAMQTLDILLWMQQDILLKADKMSMAASLELRVPFLDREVFAIASRLPTGQRVSRRETKIALRAAAARTLPPRTAAMPKKGFLTPLATWLKRDRWAAELREVFHCETARRYFDAGRLDQLLADHQAGRAHNMKKLWSPYCFLLWHDQYF